jgi:hypothetical protein
MCRVFLEEPPVRCQADPDVGLRYTTKLVLTKYFVDYPRLAAERDLRKATNTQKALPPRRGLAQRKASRAENPSEVVWTEFSRSSSAKLWAIEGPSAHLLVAAQEVAPVLIRHQRKVVVGDLVSLGLEAGTIAFERGSFPAYLSSGGLFGGVLSRPCGAVLLDCCATCVAKQSVIDVGAVLSTYGISTVGTSSDGEGATQTIRT